MCIRDRRYFTEYGKPALQKKTICGGIYARVCCILVRVQCRCKESSRSLSHLLMSFLFFHVIAKACASCANSTCVSQSCVGASFKISVIVTCQRFVLQKLVIILQVFNFCCMRDCEGGLKNAKRPFFLYNRTSLEESLVQSLFV